MFKILYNFWYTLKAIVVVGYVFGGKRDLLKRRLGMIIRLASYVLFDPKTYSNYWNKVINKVYRHIPRSNHNDAISREETHKKEDRNQGQFKYLAEKIGKNYIAALALIKFIVSSKKLNCVTVQVACGALGTLYPYLIGAAWVFEKMGMSVKLIQNNYLTFFENPILFPHACPPENFAQVEKSVSEVYVIDGFDFFMYQMSELAAHRISSEYGYKIISMLTIKQEIQQQADEWYHNNIKGKCIGVHYRGTDTIDDLVRRINIDDYINYLKRVLDEESYILACSDQKQFIDQTKIAFSGRVITRDIVRSDTNQSLHDLDVPQQSRDAFIDMLILAKTETIYTTGSRFVDCVRFFNPIIKIVSLEGRHRSKIGSKRIPNYQPIPEIDLVDKIRQEV